MKKPIIYAIAISIGIVVVLAVMKALQIMALIQAGETMLPPPETVSSFEVQENQWETSLNAIGSLEAVQGVNITTDAPGRVTEILFTAGAEVKQGEVLLRQDISSEKAQLRAAEAAVTLAKANLARQQELLKTKLVSKIEFDTADAQYKQAKAEADVIRATIAKKNITAPFSGRLGLRLVNLGQELASGTPIVTLQSIDEIYANFHLPQRYFSLVKEGLIVRLQTDVLPNQIFEGKITAINPEVDKTTRNVRLQATFNNQEKVMLAGMFVSLTVVLPQQKNVVVIPSTAILYATYGDSVFVIEKNDQDQLIGRQQFVKLGEAQGDYVEIVDGLELGQTIASAGVFKLRNGAPLAINNDVVPDFSLNPSPADQ